MEQNIATTLVSETAAPAPSKPRAAQRRRSAERIILARELFDAVQNDTAYLTLLAPFGYDAASFARGAALQVAAQQMYNDRQRATGSRNQARNEFHRQWRAAAKTYSAFRQLARGIFPFSNARLSLGLNGPVLREIEPFLAQAQATYTTALTTPEYLSTLTANGYPASELEANLAQLQSLITAINALGAAAANAKLATAQRENAVTDMETWLRRFRAVARYALRNQPELTATIRV